MPLRQKKKYKVKTKETSVEIRQKKERTTEDKMYWARVFTGIGAAILGVGVFQIIGWRLLIYMIAIWWGFPWFVSFVILREPYVKDKWDWKMIMKTGWGAFFFMFMLIGTIIWTLIVMPQYIAIFASPTTIITSATTT